MDIKQLMKQASAIKKIQKEIKNSLVSDESGGVKLSITGDGKVKEFKIPQETFTADRKELETSIKSVIESCLKKQNQIQQQKAKEAMGGMGGLSGLMG